MWFGAAAMRSFAEKRSDGPVSPHLRMTQYHSLEIFYPHEGNVARDPTPPIEQGEMEEPWPLLPSFPFSPSWWKGLQTGQPRSIRAVNKKEAFGAMKTRRGRVHLCLLKMQSVTPNHKPANSSTSHPSHARALPSLQRNPHCGPNLCHVWAQGRCGKYSDYRPCLRGLHISPGMWAVIFPILETINWGSEWLRNFSLRLHSD